MKKFWKLLMLCTLTFSCNSFEPRKIDWQKEWEKNGQQLKVLNEDIMKFGSSKYQFGENEFPNGFRYPFNEGFIIRCDNSDRAKESDKLDVSALTITYYMDRGLLDHYTAFVFSNDSLEILDLDTRVANGGNDFKIENHWYIIQE